MPCAGSLIVGFVALTTGLPSLGHWYVHGAPCLLQTFLAFFCGLNVMICYWELALFYRYTR